MCNQEISETALEPRIVLKSLQVENPQTAFPSLAKNWAYLLYLRLLLAFKKRRILFLRPFSTALLYTDLNG